MTREDELLLEQVVGAWRPRDRDGGVRGYYDTDAQGLDEVFHRSWHVLLEEDR